MQTASDILRIQEKNARKLFPGDQAEVKKIYRKLASRWHPDHCDDPIAGEVFDHLTKLMRAVDAKSGKCPAASAPERIYTTSEGKTYRFRHLSVKQGDLGDVLVGRKNAAFETQAEFEDIADAENRRIAGFRFADDGMKNEMARFLPSKTDSITAAGKRIAILSKSEDAVLLSDLLDHCGGVIPAVHVAWIVSGMLNIACYLHWAGVSHGAISATTVFVSPQTHAVYLVGGWGFATEYGKRPAALPERTTSILPRLAVKGSVTDATVDLQLVRATAQELLSAPGGGGLAMKKDVPQAMKQWLVMPPLENAFEDYGGWMKCLEESFGKRSFVDMGIKASDVYEI